jgi:hypothetical protein
MRASFVVSGPVLGVLLLATTTVTGCAAGDAESAAAADVPFEVSVSELSVTVFNQASRPLTDVKVTIIPAGALRYSHSAPRIEPRSRRAFPTRDFRAHEGSPLDLRVARPRAVHVTAIDDEGREHELQVPWRR